MPNSFLEKVKQKLVDNGVDIEIDGDKYKYVDLTRSEYTEVAEKATALAIEATAPAKKELIRVVLQKEDRDRLTEELGPTVEKAYGKLKTKYDYVLRMATLQNMSALIASYAVRWESGDRLFADHSEAIEVGQTLLGLPGAEAAIEQAQKELEEKKKQQANKQE